MTRFDLHGESVVLATRLDGVGAIALDDASLYAMQSATDVSSGFLGEPQSPLGIVRIPKSGGAATALVELRSAPLAIALADSTVY